MIKKFTGRMSSSPAKSCDMGEIWSDMLAGKKIILRRVEKADLWQLWQWHEMENLYLFNRLKPYISYDEVNETFNHYFQHAMDFIIENGEKPIGVCSYYNIFWKNRSCEVAFRIYQGDTGLSYGLDAVSTLLKFLIEDLNIIRIDSFVPEYD
ncbi:MAG TPA: N-acetyltransferase, partial [Desulfobacteraceae bacterium]|nr:N-acetyltransferase [Desulfobacteraceae bacterium]